MLSSIRCFASTQAEVPRAPQPDDRWSRDMQEDMKEAIDLVFKFKSALDKLHPECLTIVERMISLSHRNY
jgi:ribonucleotide reductase beta subunit family protein with ferritin-like domain